MNWQDARDRYREWLIASGASSGTARLYLHYLDRLAVNVGGDPTAACLDQLLTFLGRPDWSPETRKSARNAVRSIFRWALLTGRVTIDPTLALPSVRVPAGVPRPTPDGIVDQALAQAVGRDRLMILLACHGLRRSEIARAHTDDLLEDELLVRGKGGRARIVPLVDELLELIRERRRSYLFPGNIDGHLSPGHVGKVLARRLGNGYTAHTLRHRFATRAYAVDRDMLAVQRLLGHSRPETTVRYVVVPNESLRRAVTGALTA
jgi:integrase/recombinase XerC